MPKWIFQKLSGDQQGVSLNITDAKEIARKQGQIDINSHSQDLKAQRNKEKSIVEAQTKRFLENDNESGMLILKNTPPSTQNEENSGILTVSPIHAPV